MKNITITKVLVALIAVSLPSVALAQLAGVPMPATLNAETMIGAYTAALLGILFIGDYSRRTRISLARANTLRDTSAAESHRLAA